MKDLFVNESGSGTDSDGQTVTVSELQCAQSAMADYLRDPAQALPPAGIEARRLAIYRDLVFNNIDYFLSAGFPVLRSLYETQAWAELVRNFIRVHRCQSPYFLEISQEFITYLSTQYSPRECDGPFMAELAHYEWVELALDVAEGSAPVRPADNTDLLTQRPVLSPVARVLGYTFPVHRIGPDFQPGGPDDVNGPTFLAVYRNRSDDIVFMELNQACARLLQRMADANGANSAELLDDLAVEMAVDPAALQDFGVQQLRQFVDCGLVGLESSSVAQQQTGA